MLHFLGQIMLFKHHIHLFYNFQIISTGIVDEDPRCFAQLGGDPMIPDTDEACAPSPLNKDECCIQQVGDKCCPGGGPCCQTDTVSLIFCWVNFFSVSPLG